MKMPVRQWFVTGRFEKREWAKAVTNLRPMGSRWPQGEERRRDAMRVVESLWPMILVLLALGLRLDAKAQDPKGTGQAETQSTPDPNDPNELWWSRWDARVKDPNNPNELLEAKWNAILSVLRAKDLDQTMRERIIDRIVSPVFDFPLMGQLALGRTHWPKLNAAQREKFIRLFVERLKALYLEKTTLYTNEKAVLKPGVQKKNTIQILMVLISNDKERSVLYKLHRPDGPSKSKTTVRWKIYDVEIEGVSILLTYRSQFDDILRRGTVEDLLSQLENPPTR